MYIVYIHKFMLTYMESKFEFYLIHKCSQNCDVRARHIMMETKHFKVVM